MPKRLEIEDTPEYLDGYAAAWTDIEDGWIVPGMGSAEELTEAAKSGDPQSEDFYAGYKASLEEAGF